MENINIPTEISNNIKSFVPRDRYMRHPTAQLIKDSNIGKAAFIIQPRIKLSQRRWFVHERIFDISDHSERYWNLDMFLNDIFDARLGSNSDSNSDSESDTG